MTAKLSNPNATCFRKHNFNNQIARSSALFISLVLWLAEGSLSFASPAGVGDVTRGHTRPRAAMYFDLFNGLSSKGVPGWRSVNPLTATQRGDIIAWALNASTQKVGDTGHVVIVAEPPVKIGRSDYNVAVYDSSGIPHNDDGRPEATSWIGKGVITFRVDSSGTPVGFQFNSHAHFHLEPIAIGRIVDSSSAHPEKRAWLPSN